MIHAYDYHAGFVNKCASMLKPGKHQEAGTEIPLFKCTFTFFHNV